MFSDIVGKSMFSNIVGQSMFSIGCLCLAILCTFVSSGEETDGAWLIPIFEAYEAYFRPKCSTAVCSLLIFAAYGSHFCSKCPRRSPHFARLWRSFSRLMALLIFRAYGAHFRGLWRSSFRPLMALIFAAYGARPPPHFSGLWRSFSRLMALAIFRAYGRHVGSKCSTAVWSSTWNVSRCVSRGTCFSWNVFLVERLALCFSWNVALCFSWNVFPVERLARARPRRPPAPSHALLSPLPRALPCGAAAADIASAASVQGRPQDGL